MTSLNRSSRRTFLGRTAGGVGAALATPYFLTAARGQDASQAPSDRPVIALVGCGGQGRWDMRGALPFADVAAVCDVDAKRAAEGAKDAKRGDDAKGSGRKVDVYEDYRNVIERPDVNVVIIGTPDHWHTKIAIEAMQAGKDVYCEKPLTLTIEEGQKICAAVKKYGRVFQVGTQQRSDHAQVFLKAIALVRSGRLGKVTKATCAIGGAPASPVIPVVETAADFNWDMWLGQAPKVEFRSMTQEPTPEFSQGYYSRGHYEFRWWYEYSGGKLTDWGAHHVDIATWALGLEQTGPTLLKFVSAKLPVPYKNGWPTVDNQYNTATNFELVAQFPEAEIRIVEDMPDGNGILFEGDKGRIHVNRERIKGKPFEELKENPLPDDAIVQVYKGKQPTGHMANFFDCVKSREEPIADVFSHHRAMTTCHLSNIAIRLGRDVKWDPVAEKVVGDDEAQSFTSREPRKGFEITV
jgi:predicted dehydrogenase